MTERQWQEVEAIVRKAQNEALQHMNTKRYDELNPILDELYDLAHGGLVCDPQAVICRDHLTDE